MRPRTLARLPPPLRLLASLAVVILLALAILNATRDSSIILLTSLDQAVGLVAGSVVYLSRARIVGEGERLRIVNLYWEHSLSVFSVTSIDAVAGIVTTTNAGAIRAVALSTGVNGGVAKRAGVRLNAWLAEAHQQRPTAPATVARQARRDLVPLVVAGAVIFAMTSVITWVLT